MRALRLVAALAVAASLAGALAGAGWAEEPRLVVSGGAKGGSYYGVAERLKMSLRLDHDIEARVVESAGSMENLARLSDPHSRVGVAFVQADALHQHLLENPESKEKLLVLGDLGRECVFVVSRQNGAIERFSDFKKNGGQQISLVDENSGAAVTWANMTRLDADFANTEVVFVDVMEALLTIKADPGLSQLAAVMLVQRPLRRSPPLELAFKDPDTYRFVPIDRTDVENATLPDGKPVYAFEEVAIGGKERSGARKVETLCTQGLVLANKDRLSKDLRGLLSRVMLEQGSRIIGEDE